ncbi:MAG: DUF952 domain-containing protein [Planctomycetota bacterium]
MSEASIFHITTAAAWEPARVDGHYRGDSLETEGFIHCSKEHQVLEVANRLFGGRTDLIVLVIDPAKTTADIVFENLEGGTELYPHHYGPLPAEAVVDTRRLVVGAAGQIEWKSD